MNALTQQHIYSKICRQTVAGERHPSLVHKPLMHKHLPRSSKRDRRSHWKDFITTRPVPPCPICNTHPNLCMVGCCYRDRKHHHTAESLWPSKGRQDQNNVCGDAYRVYFE